LGAFLEYCLPWDQGEKPFILPRKCTGNNCCFWFNWSPKAHFLFIPLIYFPWKKRPSKPNEKKEKEKEGNHRELSIIKLISVKAVDQWREVLHRYLAIPTDFRSPKKGTSTKTLIPMILLANKSDLGKPVVKPSDLDMVLPPYLLLKMKQYIKKKDSEEREKSMGRKKKKKKKKWKNLFSVVRKEVWISCMVPNFGKIWDRNSPSD